MRTAILFLAVCTLVAVATGAETKHRWVCVDNGANRLIHVDQNDTARDWTVAIPGGSRDLQSLGDGKLLVSHGNGAAVYDLSDGKRCPLGCRQVQGHSDRSPIAQRQYAVGDQLRYAYRGGYDR